MLSALDLLAERFSESDAGWNPDIPVVVGKSISAGSDSVNCADSARIVNRNAVVVSFKMIVENAGSRTGFGARQ